MRKKKASLSYKEAWKKRLAIKENITLVMSILSLIFAIVVLLFS